MKRLLKAILWIMCYGGASWFAIKTKLGFDVLLGSHWKLLFDKSVHAHWPSDMADKKLVCKVLLGFIIVGILGLAVVTKKKKTRIPVVKEELPQKESFRPAPMASQGKMTTPAPTQTTPSAEGGSFATPSFIVPSVNLMTEAIRKLTDIANSFEVSVFPHVKLENTFTQLVVSDDTNALLLKILPQTGKWKVEKADLAGESLWSLEGEEPKKLLKDIIESTATLARLEPEAHSTSVIVMAGGSIDNAAEIKDYLNQRGIRIVTLDDQETADIQTWQSLLAEFYPPKGKENENEASNFE